MKKQCKYCSQKHDVYYVVMINNTKHMAYDCNLKSRKGKLIRVYVPKVEGLDIETRYSGKYKEKYDIQDKQLSLI